MGGFISRLMNSRSRRREESAQSAVDDYIIDFVGDADSRLLEILFSTINYSVQAQSNNQAIFRFAPETAPLNTQTFLWNVPVTDIPSTRSLQLDGYLFDVNELVEYATADLHKLFINPHLHGNENKEFTSVAKMLMKNHPQLRVFVMELEHRIQTDGISSATVDALIVMLNIFHREIEQQRTYIENGVVDYLADMDQERHPVPEACECAQEDFNSYINSLSPAETTKLKTYIVRIPNRYGGMLSLPFADIIDRGQCMQILQIYGWQFVVTLRPEAMSQVPSIVLAMAYRYGRQIRPHLPLEAAINSPAHTQASEVSNELNARLQRDFDIMILPHTNNYVLAHAFGRSLATRPQVTGNGLTFFTLSLLAIREENPGQSANNNTENSVAPRRNRPSGN